jgi:hypothetical protein
MRYMFLVYSSESAEGPSAEEVEYSIRGHGAFMEDARRQGILVACDALKPTYTATAVSHAGKAVVLDGPFAETEGQLARYYILECPHLDEALKWAKRIPTSCQGCSVEIRPMTEEISSNSR